VVHCGSGPTGRVTLLALLNRPDLEVVGHLAFNPDKEGQDSGKLIGHDKDLGIKATCNIDALISLKPDILTYVGNGNETETTVDTCCRFLKAGINISTPCLFWMVEPSTASQKHEAANTTDATHIKAIESACQEGGSTCFLTGSDPGFFSPYLAVALLKGADEVNEVRLQELGNYAYHNVPWMQDVFGFGRSEDFKSVMSQGAGVI
jgi:hypothetical protein